MVIDNGLDDGSGGGESNLLLLLVLLYFDCSCCCLQADATNESGQVMSTSTGVAYNGVDAESKTRARADPSKADKNLNQT